MKSPQEKFIALVIAVEIKLKIHNKKNPILSSQLENEFQIAGSQVRDIIHLLRRQGLPIANAGGQSEGYFYADNYGELEPTLIDLKSREDSMRTTRLAMMKRFNMHEGLFA